MVLHLMESITMNILLLMPTRFASERTDSTICLTIYGPCEASEFWNVHS